MSEKNHHLFSRNYQQLSVKYDPSHEVLWSLMHQKNRVPCFNADLIKEITQFQNELEATCGVLDLNNEIHQIKYVVAASLTPNVFNLGGHLALMHKLIVSKNKEGLREYATRGINGLAHRISRFNVPSIITISLLQGQTLGAGLEAALTSDIIIAERKSVLGFPEMIFNMIPGMGGYRLAARRIGNKLASEMINTGTLYCAEEAHEMGLIDVLVDNNEGVNAVNDWIESNRFSTGFLALQKVKDHYNPIAFSDLQFETENWLDLAFELDDHQLSMIERFARVQANQYVSIATEQSNVVSFKQSA